MDRVIYDYYSNIEAKSVDWLWFPYIPFGKLTVIQGDPGEGKSTFVLNLLSLLTKGHPMPDGLESARSIAIRGGYEFIEVYHDCFRCVSSNGSVAVVPR